MKKMWTFVKGKQFLPHYGKIEYTSHAKQKMNQKGSDGKEVNFSPVELERIRKGFIKMSTEILKEIDHTIKKVNK